MSPVSCALFLLSLPNSCCYLLKPVPAIDLITFLFPPLRILFSKYFLKNFIRVLTIFILLSPTLPRSSPLDTHCTRSVSFSSNLFIMWEWGTNLPHPVLVSELQSWACISSDFCVPNTCYQVGHHSCFMSGFEVDIEPISQCGWKHQRVKQVQAEWEPSFSLVPIWVWWELYWTPAISSWPIPGCIMPTLTGGFQGRCSWRVWTRTVCLW